MSFPLTRPRRLRLNANIRSMVEETNLSLSDLIYPLFIKHGKGEKKEISSMPGQYQMTVDYLEKEIKEIKALGLKSVLLFGIPECKDATGSDNYNSNGIVPQAIKTIKEIAPEMIVISDMCFCEYTDHGHCGIVNTKDSKDYNQNLPEGYLLNDETLELLCNATIVHAQAGADIIAPSGMIDGMISSMRQRLDDNNFEHTILMSYSAKYASSFYGPFREAADGAPKFGDRAQYQMDPKNGYEALREVEIDLAEGADIIMIKPALSYLDVIARVKDTFNVPIAAYNVSGEYAMVHAAAKNNWIDYRRTATEVLTSIKRAGAKMVITYFAKDMAKWINE
jgi:porphobilinogen synthase